jgi:predicted dehydrogenase
MSERSIPAGPLRVALVGAGIFARDAHLPSLLRHPDSFEIRAVYSRTAAGAQTLVDALPTPVAVTTDLDALLARADIDAVLLLLPITALPDAIRRALAAGKHLLSEKPIAPTVAQARDLLAKATHHPQTVWMVGENWRYEAAFQQAARLVRDGAIGRPLTCHWAVYTPITSQNKYYHTLWRRDSSFPGGFLLDGGVHHLAVLRLILGEVVQVSAVTRLNNPELPPTDTVAATLSFANGAVGTYLATYAAGAPWPPHLYIAGTTGSLRVQRREIEWTHDGQTERITTPGFDGVEQELLDFAAAVRQGNVRRDSPEEALRDLALLEAILTSAATQQPVTPAGL